MKLDIKGLRVDAGTGPGSRGGIVVGHRSNGEPIYSTKKSPKHMAAGTTSLGYRHKESGREARITRSSALEGCQSTGSGRREPRYQISVASKKGGLFPQESHGTLHEAHAALESEGYVQHTPIVNKAAVRAALLEEIETKRKQAVASGEGVKI